MILPKVSQITIQMSICDGGWFKQFEVVTNAIKMVIILWVTKLHTSSTNLRPGQIQSAISNYNRGVM